MRKLTVKRQKSFVGCLGTMKVYIENAGDSDIVIGDTPCKFLGKLKNGEEKTFEITESSAKVYVIADKLSKNYCNDFFAVPAGNEDVYLSGKNSFNPITGNPFRFDGVTDEESQINRKKTSKRGVLIFTVSIILGIIIGLYSSGLFSPKYTSPAVFDADRFAIELTDDFRENSELATENGLYACFESSDVAVLILCEEFAYLEGFDVETAEDYAKLFIEANAMTDSKVETDNGICHFDYTAVSEGKTFYYFAACLKGKDAFWMFQFVTQEKDFAKFEERIYEWASSIVVN